MNKSTNFIGIFRLRFLAASAVLFLLLNLSLRLVLPIAFPGNLPLSADLLPGLLKGVINDAAALVYVLLLPATLILPPTDKFLRRPTGRIYCLAILFLFSAIFIFTAFAEYFFWEEFASRFNFIAVDYLIYTTELLQNMIESYPLVPLLTVVFILAVAAAWLIFKLASGRPHSQKSDKPEPEAKTRKTARFGLLAGFYAAAGLLFLLFTPISGTENRFWDDYAKNGVYELFSAYLHNELDYRDFYATMDQEEAFAVMRDELGQSADLQANLVREIRSGSPEKKPNVIVVIMESMGTQLLGEYTPNLNALAANGLSFSNMMATGTRTVRGIEAIMLSVPPTPGNSIVRRPDNRQLFNMGTLFRQRGYDLSFIYSGLGYFDNMNAFFAGNGYQVVDKLGFAPQNKTFATAWGQCDEDLFSESLLQADKSYSSGKPFQQVLLTTSNHRPFTYPEGKVAIAPGTGRTGAVNYSDYAIGEFMKTARSKPWFDNTVFLFVGDHPSSIAGKTDVPPDAYNITCVMYGPDFFAPEQIDTLCSQIDTAPTLLAALGWDYRSLFFGADVRAMPKSEGRAWISTYQLLGFRDNEHLVILRPNRHVEVFDIHGEQDEGEMPRIDNDELAARTIASYQSAYDLFSSKGMKESSMTPDTR